MTIITAADLAKEQGITQDELLIKLRSNVTNLTKDEKIVLTELLNSKRGSGRKTIASKSTLSVKPGAKKSTGVLVQVKRKKAPIVSIPEEVVLDENAQQELRTHQDSIEQSRLAEQVLIEQDEKRQAQMRKQTGKVTHKKEKIQALKEEKPKAIEPEVAVVTSEKPVIKEASKPEEVVKETTTVEPPIKKSREILTKSIFAPAREKKKEPRRIVVIKRASVGQTPSKTTDNKPVGRYNPSSRRAPAQARKLKKKDKTRLSQKLREESVQHGFVKPVEKVIQEVRVPESIQVSALAQLMNTKAAQVLKQMMGMGVMATINDTIDQDTAMLVVEEMGHTAIAQGSNTVEDAMLSELEDVVVGDSAPRPPIVTIMGHVDHGKTSLLDYIRKAKVAKGEAGGITQHIGAYQVDTGKSKITFLDTPGHAAFTQMRARGANATDIVILVVAADDGVMPETIDSIKHAKVAGATIIVAINKMDKEGADPEKVKQILSTHEVIAEDWGGDTIMSEVSAHTGQGIDTLLDAITLQAEVMELNVVTKARAKGVVLEARLDKGRGKVATLLVQEGTLKKGDIIVAGQEYGKIKQVLSDTGKVIKGAQPSMPVEVLGLSGVPDAGDEFVVLTNEKKAKEVADFRRAKNKEQKLQKQQAMKMEDFMHQMQQANKQKLNVLLKADVHGSTQALTNALEELSTEELTVNVVSSGVGGINDSDMNLAATSGAVVLGFSVRADAVAKKTADREKVDVRYYSVIYNLIDDIKAMMSGLIAPELSENIIGLAQVKEVFKSKALGEIAGCIVLEGKMKMSSPIRVLRDSVVIYEGELESLRRFKDEVKEVVSGTECGIGVKDYNDVQAGDQIEAFEQIQTPVKL